MFVLPRATDETAVYLALMRISDENTVLMHPSTTLFFCGGLTRKFCAVSRGRNRSLLRVNEDFERKHGAKFTVKTLQKTMPRPSKSP